MLDAAHTLLPEAEVGFIGVSRNENTFQPEPYLNTVPDNLQGRAVLVLEPMLATGGSLGLCVLTTNSSRRRRNHRGLCDRSASRNYNR